MFLKNYDDKAEQLKQQLQDQQKNPNQVDLEELFVVINENLFDKDFQDLDLKYEPQKGEEEKIPQSKRLRPFYFMRKIEKTMMEGTFLTEGLFVPKYVWYQKEAKLPEIDKKLHYFDGLKKEIQGEIDKLLAYMLLLQDTLAQEFNEVKKNNADDVMKSMGGESAWNRISKTFKNFTEKVTKGAQKIAFNIYGTSVDNYAKALQDLFKEVYFIEQWIIELEQQNKKEDQQLLAKLGRISQFLHEVVVLIVLSDLRYLIKRYLKKMFVAMTELHSKIN